MRHGGFQMGPLGLFIGMTAEELQSEILIARERIRNGDRTGLSGAAKSSQKDFSMPADRHLQEALYAYRKLTGQGLPTETYFDAARAGNRAWRGC